MFTAETGQSEKADAATSVTEPSESRRGRQRSSQLLAESWCPQSSVDEGDIDNIGDHTATLCTVNGNLDTNNMSQHSGVTSRQSNAALREAKDSNAQTQVLDIMNQSKAFCPLISFVQCVHPASRSPSLKRMVGKGTGGAELEEHRAQIQREDRVFSLSTISRATRSECDGLSRVCSWLQLMCQAST